VPPGPSWLRRNLGLVAAGAGVLALATVGALALALILKPAASVGKLIPSSADVYVSVALDPSMTQKINLVNLVHKFPDFKTDAGIIISVGTPLPGGSKEPTAYAYVDHAVVLANTDALIREIIDTDQNKHVRLVDTAAYKATLSQLPSDRLALLYVNGTSVVS